MNDNTFNPNINRLIEILRPFGTIEALPPNELQQTPTTPQFDQGTWLLPLDETHGLQIKETSLPEALSDLLKLHLSVVYPAVDSRHSRQQVTAWLADESHIDSGKVEHALQQLGWTIKNTRLILIEVVNQTDDKPLADAFDLLGELLEQDRTIIAKQTGRGRIAILLSTGEEEELEPEEELTGWLNTLGAELFLLCRAGLSNPIAETSELQSAKWQAEFALEAGKRYRSQESVHRFEQLGLARILHGLPKPIRDDFLREVLPENIVTSLTPELRETVFAFLEHGQQVADTARTLYVHRNTLLYRLERVTELTGYDIRKPLDLWTLWLALTLHRTK